MRKEKEYYLRLPKNKNHLLLHSCCSPFSGEIIQSFVDCYIKFSIFFYNTNIHPLKEYEIRKEENI
ncbi:MAG: epoxyqueuosine reductase QueH, partial [Pseudomonadota bacterium]|nr:epoxyqueuosine reductase QueH [Pseudomonadota bacterium]